MRLTRLFTEFFESEKSAGLILVIATIISLLLANSPLKTGYLDFWNMHFAGHNLTHWINDGLMTVFFLLIGLELEREIYIGELSNIRSAALPVFGAIGGMLVPFGIYYLLNWGTNTISGAGIPMATDIAFAIGILSLLGSRVQPSLKVFLTALAVIDDLGAIIVIAIFYSKSLILVNLLIALSIFVILLVLNKMRVQKLTPFIIGGVIMWYFMLQSGIHATIAGVMLAFAIPFGDGDEKSPSFKTQHFLHKPVAFIILPLFALANTCIPLGSNWLNGIGQTSSLGIIAGLVIGKPVGIFLATFIATSLGVAVLPAELNWKAIFGAGILGGIGFTMSIFISLLAFDNSELINNSKIAILLGSTIAGLIGLIWISLSVKSVSKNIAIDG
jgi:Na+:H+ antiporter, NhaA family